MYKLVTVILGALFTIIPSVSCLSFNYLQEYLVGEDGHEMTASQIKGIIQLKSILIGDDIEWLLQLKNFSIQFNDTKQANDILNITCTTFVSNPLLHTLLLDAEDPTKNTCPDELKQLISSTLLTFNNNQNKNRDDISKDKDKNFIDHLNFGPNSNVCRSFNKKYRENDLCIVTTTLQTSNCTNDADEPKKNELNLTRTSLFNFFKLNYTIEAVFDGIHGCDITITSMKNLTTTRFYVKNETNDNYACIREKYTLIEDEEDSLEKKIELTVDIKEVKEPHDEAILDAKIDEKVKVQWKSEPAEEWFEMFSLINSIYAANVVYGTLSEWVFS